MRELDINFFKKDAVFVAKNLVGKILCIDGVCSRILDVEAYKDDEASHARKRTPRSEIMFDSFGKVYVYLIYGMYHCLNFTCDINGPGAVLIRRLDMQNCDGPGKLCSALNISKKDNNTFIGSRFKIFDDNFKAKVVAKKRIGIKNDTHLLWRFVID